MPPKSPTKPTPMKRLGHAIFQWLKGAVTRNIAFKALALGIAILLWGMVREEQDVEEIVNVSLTIDTPDDLIYLNQISQYINVRITGRRSRLRNAQEANLQMTVDLVGAVPGENTINLARYKIKNLPSDIDVAAYYPAVLTLDIDRLIEKEVPIQVRTVGKPPTDIRLVDTQVTPSTIALEGAARQLEPMEQIFTEPVNVSTLDGDRTLTVELDYGDTSISPKGRPEEVRVAVDVEAVIAERIFKEVPLRLVSGDDRFTVAPAATSVRVTGPKSQVDAYTPEFVRVFLDPAQVGPEAKLPLRVRYQPDTPGSAPEKGAGPPVRARLTRSGSPDVTVVEVDPAEFTLLAREPEAPEAPAPGGRP